MAGIRLFQPNGAGLVNDVGASHPDPVDIEVNLVCQLSAVDIATSTYRWVLTKPAGSSSVLSSATSAGPSFLPDVEGGSYSISLFDIDENEYVLDIVTPTTGGGGGGGGGGTQVGVTFNTYDDVRAAAYGAAAPPASFVVKGRSEAGDGGEGTFVFLPDGGASDNDGTFLENGDGDLFERIYSGEVDPRWFGVLADGTANDAAAWAATLALFGDSSTRMRAGILRAPNGCSLVSSTIGLTRFSGVLTGAGAGTQLGATCSIKWSGTTTDPMIRLQRCWATHIENLRLIGNAAHPPSAAIDLHTVNGEGPYNTDISIENLWIGGISGEDSAISNGFANGITFSGVGDPVQNDQSTIRKCSLQDISTCGIDIQTAQATIIAIEDCKFNAMPVGIQTVSRGLVIKNCFFSTITDTCVKLAGDSGVHLENNGCEGCAQLLTGDAGVGAGITIRGEYFQVNQRTLDAGASVIDIDATGGYCYLDIDHLNITSDGAASSGEAKIRVTNCSYLYLRVHNVNWYDSLSLIDHVDIATASGGQKRLVVWDYQGKEYVNYWEHGAHANAQMGMRVDHPNGVTISSGAAIDAIAVDGTTRQIIMWHPTGPFASKVEVGDAVTPIVTSDLEARGANIDLKYYRNVLGLLGYISWDGTSMGGVKAVPNEGTPESVVAAESGSLCLDYDTPALWFKVTGSGDTGWSQVATLTAGSVVRVLRGMPFVVEADADVDEYGRVVINTTAGTSVKWTIDAPKGCSLTGVELEVIGGGNGSLPANMPLFRVRTIKLSDNTVASQGPFSDASINTTQYNAVHSIEASLTPITVDNQDHRYSIEFISESGANAVTGFMVIGIYLTFTPAASLDMGAA